MYTRKTAAKGNICSICSKFTTTVLRNDFDFFYVCDNHLGDSTFCKIIYAPVPEVQEVQEVQETAKDNTVKEGILDNLKKSINSGFINNIQKALFTQMEFENVDKSDKQEILGYELTKVFLYSRQQYKERKLLKKVNAEKKLELLNKVDEWPKIPDNDL